MPIEEHVDLGREVAVNPETEHLREKVKQIDALTGFLQSFYYIYMGLTPDRSELHEPSQPDSSVDEKLQRLADVYDEDISENALQRAMVNVLWKDRYQNHLLVSDPEEKKSFLSELSRIPVERKSKLKRGFQGLCRLLRTIFLGSRDRQPDSQQAAVKNELSVLSADPILVVTSNQDSWDGTSAWFQSLIHNDKRIRYLVLTKNFGPSDLKHELTHYFHKILGEAIRNSSLGDSFPHLSMTEGLSRKEKKEHKLQYLAQDELIAWASNSLESMKLGMNEIKQRNLKRRSKSKHYRFGDQLKLIFPWQRWRYRKMVLRKIATMEETLPKLQSLKLLSKSRQPVDEIATSFLLLNPMDEWEPLCEELLVRAQDVLPDYEKWADLESRIERYADESRKYTEAGEYLGIIDEKTRRLKYYARFESDVRPVFDEQAYSDLVGMLPH